MKKTCHLRLKFNFGRPDTWTSCSSIFNEKKTNKANDINNKNKPSRVNPRSREITEQATPALWGGEKKEGVSAWTCICCSAIDRVACESWPESKAIEALCRVNRTLHRPPAMCPRKATRCVTSARTVEHKNKKKPDVSNDSHDTGPLNGIFL